MPTYRTPGVYVEEVPGGARAIAAVGTSTTAFFGRAPDAHASERIPVFVTSYQEFKRTFVGEASGQSVLATAVAGFFDNGGDRLYVVNLGPKTTSLSVEDLKLVDAIEGISLVAAPGYTDAGSYDALIADCEARGDRFAVLDAPESAGPQDLTQTTRNGGARPPASDRGFAAVYAPWLAVCDANTGERVSQPSSGHICGHYAETDKTRGVHKAPAGSPLRGVLGLDRSFTQPELAILNAANVNGIRALPNGISPWGARTLADQASEWRYVPVRRLAIMIEQSIERGTRWVVFEPNDQPLWASLRRDVSAFLNTLWRGGALAGNKPEEAFFVRCDRQTMTQADIDAGRVIAEIGFAPLRPAEFIILRITQKAA